MYHQKRRNNGKYRNPLSTPVEEELPPDDTPQVGWADTTNANMKVYLVKLPKSLYEKFSNPPTSSESAPVLGRLRIDGNDKSSVPKIFIDSVPGTAPIVYDMHFQPEPPRIAVFSEARDALQSDVRVEGRVSYQCTAQPNMDSRYRGFNRDRVRQASTKTRIIEVMDDNTRRMADNAAMRPMTGVETAREKEERKRRKEASRKHLDIPEDEWRELAKAAIYRAYESQHMYTADSLAREVDEPLNRLRACINELCNYNKSGPFANHYVLKNEYMTESQRLERNNLFENWKIRMQQRKEDRTADEREKKKARR